MTVNKKTISDTIANVSFPLMVCVIISHCAIGDSGNAAMDGVSRLFSSILPISCVPVFFLMSGYLFFCNIEKFTFKVYKTKVYSRVRTLLVPYILANTFMILCYAFMHAFTPSLINPENFNVLRFSVVDFFKAFWSIDGFPICYPLWYIRNLFVIVLCSPCFYLMLQFKWVGARLGMLVLMFIIYIAFNQNYLVGGLYFYLGALLSQKDVVTSLERILNPRLYTLLAAIAIIAIYYNYVSSSNVWMHIQRLSVAILIIRTFYILSTRIGRVQGVIFESSFFIYLYHAFPVLVLRPLLIKVISPTNSVAWITTYAMLIIASLIVCIGAYCILKRYVPSLLSIFVGGRNLKR